MNIKNQFKGIQFFWRGLKAAKQDMWASLQVLVIATFILGTILYFVEHSAQPEVYAHWYDPYLWGVMSYLGNPGMFSPGEPITMVGRSIAICISIIKILIFAVPAGLVANGFREAMAQDKRSVKLSKMRKRMRKSFRRRSNKTLREYINTLPDKGGEMYKNLNFVPRRCTVAQLQVKQGMGIQDIIDTVMMFPEFRLKNLASAVDEEEMIDDRLVVEMVPINRPYGFCKNRHSRVTIVSTSGHDEVGTSWFTYYLAKFGGFNYISKEVEIDPDEQDSFFNMSKEPLYNKHPRSYYESNKKAHRNELKILEHKQKNRDAFLDDLDQLTHGVESPWVIIVAEHIKNASNKVDFHFCDNNKNGDRSTVKDLETYEAIFSVFAQVMNTELHLESVKTKRFPFMMKNLLYLLEDRESFPVFNGFMLRPSSQIMSYDSRSLLIALRMAQTLSGVLTPGAGMLLEEKTSLASGFGYEEQEVEKQDIYVIER